MVVRLKLKTKKKYEMNEMNGLWELLLWYDTKATVRNKHVERLWRVDDGTDKQPGVMHETSNSWSNQFKREKIEMLRACV